MKINLDVVISNCNMTLDELNRLQEGQIKPIEEFVQSEVQLKSGNEIVAKGILIQVDGQYCVSVDHIVRN